MISVESLQTQSLCWKVYGVPDILASLLPEVGKAEIYLDGGLGVKGGISLQDLFVPMTKAGDPKLIGPLEVGALTNNQKGSWTTFNPEVMGSGPFVLKS